MKKAKILKAKTGDGAPKTKGAASPSRLIDVKIKALGDWRGDTLARVRATYKDKVKLTFARGAALKDPSRLFNASLDGNLRRAIDIPEGGKIDEAAFKALVRAAVELNTAKKSKRA